MAMRLSPPVASILCAVAVAATPIVMTAAADGIAVHRILLCGDSMLKAVARSITREFAATPSVTIDQVVSIGTGLARPDVFDWPAKLREALTARPDVVVIFLGANDGQNLQTASGVAANGTPEWEREYARRVAALLGETTKAGVRRVLWIGLPDMRERKLHEDCRRINAIVRAECAKVAGAEFFDIAPLFSPKPGTYSAYVVRPDGKVIQTRASDGTHFNADGADILARAIRERLAGK